MRLRVRVQRVLLLLKATTTRGSSSGSSSKSRAHNARGKQAIQILLTITGILVCAKGMYIFESSPWAPLTPKHDGWRRSASTVAAAKRDACRQRWTYQLAKGLTGGLLPYACLQPGSQQQPLPAAHLWQSAVCSTH